MSKAGAPASARFGGSEASVIALTPSGEVQWWDTAMLKVFGPSPYIMSHITCSFSPTPRLPISRKSVATLG